MNKEKEYWQSFETPEAVSEAIWAADDKMENVCLNMIIPWLKTKLKPRCRVFDLGCGNGRLLHPLSEIYPKVSFTGIDFSKPMLQFAATSPNIEYVLNDGVTIPFDDNYFDGGYSMIVFQHIPNDDFANYLKEVARVLKPGGVFVFQFVEGDQHHFLSHNATVQDVTMWILKAGLHVAAMTGGIISVWKWVTVIK